MVSSRHFSERLIREEACGAAVEWARTMPDVKTAYDQCLEIDWFEWVLTMTGSWPRGAHDEYLARRKPLDSAYGKERKPINDAYFDQRRVINDEYLARRKPLDDEYFVQGEMSSDEYLARCKPLDVEYHARITPVHRAYLAEVKSLDAKYSVQLIALLKSIVPVEVFEKALR